ncbi:hypothetical protein VTO42DRAFT_2479 [Malbranchea cinnamomea]
MAEFYPKARQPRPSTADPSVRTSSQKMLRAALINFILLQLVFLSLFSYIFGSLYQHESHVHNLNIVWVDYDGGVIGDAIRHAYGQLQGKGFPTLIERSPDDFGQPSSLQSAVCNINYWGALYLSPGASDRLAAALAGGAAASSYNQSDILTYIWNEARYPTVVDSGISGALKQLSDAARVALSRINGTGAMQVLDPTDPAAVRIYSNPWELVSINLQPTTQGSRLIYNTLVVILILIQDFFYVGTLNGLNAQFKIWSLIDPIRVALVRLGLSVAYTFVGSLCTAGAIWAFRAGWNVSGGQFMLTWMTLWLFAHLNFLTLDVFTIWLPPPFVPMALISWVVISVSAILLPFELSPGFFRWAYALPSFNVYQVLVDIWSGGCNPRLHHALPVMFAYELSSLVLSTIGVYRRAHYAVIAQEKEEKAFQDLIQQHMRPKSDGKGSGRRSSRSSPTKSQPEKQRTAGHPDDDDGQGEDVESAGSAATVTLSDDEEDLARRIWRETSQLQRERSRASNMGPSFDLVGE